MLPPLVVSVILNTNRREDTLECLASLRQATYPNHRVLVLDNASTDGSAAAIQSAFPEVQVLALSENLGYTGNNNFGMRAALEMGAEWVLVLNEDVTIAPDALNCLIAAAAGKDQAGILGPLVYHYDEPGIIQSAGGLLDRHWSSYHRGHNEPDRGQYSTNDIVDWISGCAILVRRPVIEQVGGLDERYFYYWEETEWCMRARAHGWKILFVPQAHAWHKGVQRKYQPGPNITYYATRNRLLTLAKHGAPWVVWAAVLAATGRTLISWTVRPKWRGMRAHRYAMWQGLLDFFRHNWGMRSV